MTLRHYMIFQEVAETGSFTRAAENLFITQSAVSHAIRQLEGQAGTRLFERLSKCVRLTRSGELLLEETRPLLASFGKLEARMEKLEEEAPIHIVSCITIAGYWLPDIIGRFHKASPQTRVQVNVVTAAAALELLRQGKTDLALIEGNILPGQYHARQFASYEMCAAAAPGYGPSSLSLEEFLSAPLLLREKGSAVRDALDSALTLCGYEAFASWTSVNSQALIQAARAGLGIAVLPEVLIRQELQDGLLVKTQVDGLQLRNPLTALLHKEKYISLPLQKFWECIF